jgi:hypothetical protein
VPIFENRVARRIFRSKREQVARGWRKLPVNDKAYILYSSPNIIKPRKMRWQKNVVVKVLWKKEPLYKRGTENDIKMDGRLLGYEDGIAQDRVQ